MKITTNIIAVSLQITERGNESIKIILAILLFCVATIALSKFNNSDLFRSVTKNFFRFKLLESNFNDENRIGFSASFLLNINFILSLTICFFLAFTNFVSGNEALIYALCFSAYLIIIQQISFRLVALLSGEHMISEEIGVLTKQIWHMAGLLFLIIALIWALNQQSTLAVSRFYFIILLTLFAFRYIKGIFLCHKMGIKWYYLFLYLCTLEIMPSLLLYNLVL
ncbi:MAG: DUF4271 domain-containing protein [Crocinitomicaceae bacterium]|jgi:hypothetical protein|nr:DUF4271 domain-containing protein [Crocinitomicaceae bacterium]NDA98928.1 DUF4271 domain-containing protein [Flavobacteriia bacterium]NDC28824.1 DUF4271 domain-containing protein [Crocinitomicaceae bacterium]NDC93206.1 DUF4271 domain-containing protein [Flavobacteriales bacterium]